MERICTGIFKNLKNPKPGSSKIPASSRARKTPNNNFCITYNRWTEIFLSCHNQKLMKEKKNFFSNFSFFLIFCTIAVYICHSDQKGCHGFCLIARMECKVKFLKSFVWLWTPLCYTTVGSPCKYNKYYVCS